MRAQRHSLRGGKRDAGKGVRWEWRRCRGRRGRRGRRRGLGTVVRGEHDREKREMWDVPGRVPGRVPMTVGRM